ncbi:MAG: EthD family reductase [Ktedonobacteraceae bacterium]
MIRLTVLYGHPQNTADFEAYYHNHHMPLASKMKGLKGFTVGMVQSAEPGQQAPYYRVASLYADTPEELQAIMSSPEAQAAVADIQNFATGGVTIFVSNEEVVIPVQIR